MFSFGTSPQDPPRDPQAGFTPPFSSQSGLHTHTHTHPSPAASGLPQIGKRLGLSNELPASKRTRRRFIPECRKTNGNLPRPPRGAERTQAVPAGPTGCRALAPAPTAAPPSPPTRAGGLTSSGGSVNLPAMQDGLLAVRCEGGGRQAARGRLHLMEKRGESLTPECGSRGCREKEHHPFRQPYHLRE